MARQKIGEYTAKRIVSEFLGLPYHGIFFNSPTDTFSQIEKLDNKKTYVVKVDEGVKKRFKQGLVKLDIAVTDLSKVIKEFQARGYSYFLVEEYRTHLPEDERYLAVQRERDGLVVYVSENGGVNIEDHQEKVQRFLAIPENFEKIAKIVNLTPDVIEKIIIACDTYHFSFLEINPLIVTGKEYFFLDLAVEVDSAGEFFVNGAWSEDSFVMGNGEKTTSEEENISLLSAKSQASFRLVVLNPQGSLWMLLSGGGASIVLADEVYNQGKGSELANYGEYSGNPTAEETYLYTKNILSLLLKAKSQNKKLIIAGGVANFTDIRVTFKGIIKDLDEVKDELQKAKVKVFVRRGGPYQEEGLKAMRDYLQQTKLLGVVAGPEMVLTDIVQEALK